MSDQSAARATTNADAYRGLRILALIAVAVGVILLAAAAFLLSYAGIHAIALQAGVSARLARLYPLIFDAMLVVGGAAVLSLRGAGLVTRCYAWLTMLVLLATAAGADALHATGTRLPHRSAAATVAIIPWALVLIGFGLLLAMLRHARLRRAAAQAARIASHGQARAHWQAPAGSQPAALPPGATSGPAPRPAAAPVPLQASALVLPGAAAPADGYADRDAHAGTDAHADTEDDDPIRYGQPYPLDAHPGMPARTGLPAHTGLAADTGLPAYTEFSADTELAVDAEAGHDDPTSDEARALGMSAAPWVPRPREESSAGQGGEYSAGTMNAAPTPDPEDDAGPTPGQGDDADPTPPDMPPFDRMQSSPTPPAD